MKLFPWVIPGILLVFGLGIILATNLPLGNIGIETAPPLAAPEASSTPPATVRLIFMGDIMLAREVGAKIAVSGDWRYPFLKIATTTQAADLAFANLESAISDHGTKIGSIYSFRADPRVVAGLSYAGIDVLSIANNHIWDYGSEAFLDTQKYLREGGIAYAGGGVDYEEAHKPVILTAQGTRVAYLAYTNLLPKFFTRPDATPASASYDDWERVLQDISAARAAADIVVVSYHWGEEYQTTHNAEQEKIAHATIDAGADLVIGHHPHVQQEVEKYGSGWIAYSLGNFVFDQYFSPEVMQSKILEVDVRDGKIMEVKEIPVKGGRNPQPEIVSP